MSLLPGISQLKSIVQLATGDVNGALKTQEDFFQTCPVVSQVTGCVQLITGNEEAAGETFKKGLDTINSIANSIPVVGHLKAAVHLACDDEERANEALKSSNRTSGVLVGGAGGFLVGGPVGAAAGGITSGAALDAAHTLIENKNTGIFENIERLGTEDHKAGAIFDLASGIVFDGIAGNCVGQTVSNAINTGQLKTKNKQINNLSKNKKKTRSSKKNEIEKNQLSSSNSAFENGRNIDDPMMNESNEKYNYADTLEISPILL